MNVRAPHTLSLNIIGSVSDDIGHCDDCDHRNCPLQAFIDRKKHDYSLGLRIMVDSQYRCWEWNMIVQGLLNGQIGRVEPVKKVEVA